MRLKVLLICALIAAGCTARPSGENVYTNPILHLDYSDPDVCRVGSDYWMTASSFNFFPGLPILHSTDLVHWELVGAALTGYTDEFKGAVRHGEGVWAPAIRYHDGWFYIFAGDPDRGIFMVRTQDPAGRWEDPVWVVKEKGFIDPCPLWDEDGRAYLSHAAAGSRAGLKSVIFVAPLSADGTSLLGPSRIVYDGHLSQPTIEGTKFFRRDRMYYIFAPAGGVATGWQTVLRSDSPYGPFEEKVVMAWAPGTVNGPHQGAWVDSPSGEDWFVHFQDKGAYGRIVHLQPMQWGADGWPVIGEDPDGDGVGQPVSSWKMTGEGDGCGDDDGCGDAGSCGAVVPVECAAAGPYGISLSWQYPAVPSPYYHMALPDGGIRLYSVEQNVGWRSLWDSPNVLQQKFPGENFTVTARLTFRPNPQLKPRGETAGFAVMGSDYAALKLTDTPAGALLQYVCCHGASKGSVETPVDLAVLPYSATAADFPYASGNVPAVRYPDRLETTLRVRLEVSALRPEGVDSCSGAPEGGVPEAVCRFAWSLDGEKFTPVGTNSGPSAASTDGSEIPAGSSPASTNGAEIPAASSPASTDGAEIPAGTFVAAPGIWTGATFGFFCNRFAPKNDSGALDITDISISVAKSF